MLPFLMQQEEAPLEQLKRQPKGVSLTEGVSEILKGTFSALQLIVGSGWLLACPHYLGFLLVFLWPVNAAVFQGFPPLTFRGFIPLA